MSNDYQDANVFSGWGERDDWRLEDEREHEHADAKHERLLDTRDRDLPYLTNRDPADECDCEMAA